MNCKENLHHRFINVFDKTSTGANTYASVVTRAQSETLDTKDFFMSNEQSDEELNKPFIQKFEKRKVRSDPL